MIDEAKLAVLTDEELARQPFEAGTVGLEESIELYRQGLRLHAACETRLREAELTITELGRRGATAVTEAPEEE